MIHYRGAGMGYEIGQRIDDDAWQAMFGKRGIWIKDADPQWYIFVTAPQRELQAEAWLRRNGVHECWFPTEPRWRRIPRGMVRKVRYMAPIVPRYLFVMIDKEPNWDVLFDRARGKLTGVVSRDGVPMPICEADMLKMRHVPVTLEAIREKRRLASMIREGDRVEVMSGPLEGWMVDVSRIHAGMARIIIPMLGLDEVDVPIDRLRRVG